jgi:8-oxo-dGTP pyrophosphatase MutT (NUDIX family)
MAWKPHVTVGIIYERQHQFLMVEEKVNGEIRFNQPAGHLEDRESLVDAAVRECMEETAREFTPQALVGLYRWRNPDRDQTFLRATFCGLCSERKQGQLLDPDITETHWMTLEDIQALGGKLRSPLVLRSINDYLAGCRYPLELLVNVI